MKIFYILTKTLDNIKFMLKKRQVFKKSKVYLKCIQRRALALYIQRYLGNENKIQKCTSLMSLLL